MRDFFNLKGILIAAAIIAGFFLFFRHIHNSQAAAAQPQLPKVYIDTTYPSLATGHVVRNVKPSCGATEVNCYTSLQKAIDAASLGEEIIVQAGMTVTGPIALRNKTTGTGWIIIRSSNMASLPTPGNRVGPSNASAMPKIVAPGGSNQSNDEAITTDDMAHNYRLVGIEIADAPNDDSNVLVSLGYEYSYCATSTDLYVVCPDQTNLSKYPYNIVLDRMYIHGDPTHNVKRGIGLNSKAAAVIDSYISDIHVVAQDSQGITGAYGPGPYKIVNNYISAAAENMIFGGDDPRMVNLIPSDIEIRNNYFYKPLTWRSSDPSYAGFNWQVKNLLELKNAQRVLIDGNIFEHTWQAAQSGYGIVFTPRNQGGSCPWCTVQDVTFQNNVVNHVGSGLNLLGHDDIGSSALAQRFLITNNLWLDISAKNWGGSGWFALLNGGTSASGPNDVTITHNTSFNTSTWIYAVSYFTAGYSTKLNAVITDNIGPHNSYGVFGDNSGVGNTTLSSYFPNGVFTKNVLMGGPSKSYSSYPGNYFPTDWSGVFVNQAGGDYHVLSTSVYHNAGTDGKDLGANIDVINTATANVISGQRGSLTPPPPPPPPPPTDTTKPVVTIFDVQPRSGASVVTASFSATDSGGSFLASAELLRAVYNSTNCLVGNITGCSWLHTQTIQAPANVNAWSGSFMDNPAAGRYLYGVHVHDGAGNIGFEPGIIDISVISSMQRLITIAGAEGRQSKAVTGQLLVFNTGNSQIKFYPFASDSSGQASVSFDIPTQVVNLKISSTPFLVSETPNVDLASSTPYSFGVLKTGDVNHDNIVNSLDYSTLNSKWFSTDAVSDLNQDGIVNTLDFSLLNKNWFLSGQ